MNFDWRTDEEESWPPRQEPPPAPPPDRRRRVFVVLIALAAVALALAYVYRQAQQRIAATEEAVAGDVLASHELVTLAARTGDAEMLRSVLSGADDDWAAAQLSRLADAPHAGRLAFGLQPLAGDEPQPDVVLNPEMRAAELTWVARYVVTDSAGLTSTVQLTQTAIYRRGDNNWLLAPPPADFWQGSDEVRGSYVEAIFPARDEVIAARLVAGLDAVVAGLCRSGCPAGFRLRLILSPDPASFADTASRTLLAAGRTIVLPTPTLVGLPVDDAAYAALERGYALLMTTAMLADRAGYECCHNGLYTGAWVHWQQHLHGLRAWPLDAAAYEAMLLNLLPTNELTGFLGANPRLLPDLSFEQWGPVYAFVQFLDEVYGPAAASGPLHAPPGSALDRLGVDQLAWTLAWPRFVYEQSLSGQRAAPPEQLPTADLAMQCTGPQGQLALQRLDPQSGATQPLYPQLDAPAGELSWVEGGYAEPFGPGKGLLLMGRQRLDTGRFEYTMRLIRDGAETTVLRIQTPTWDELPEFTPLRADPAGRYLALADFTARRDAGVMQPPYFVADLQSCDGDGCLLRVIPGHVTWSPDGTHSLVVSEYAGPNVGRSGGMQLYEGDAAVENLQPVGWTAGIGLTWLDENHYAYTALPPEEPELVVRAVGWEDALLRFSLAALWEMAGAGDARPLNTAVLSYGLTAHPQDPSRLLLSAIVGVPGAREDSLFLVQLAPQLDGVVAGTLLTRDYLGYAFSPTGRWLSLYRHASVETNNRFELLDLEAQEPTAPKVSLEAGLRGTFSWAADGDWLALTGQGYVLLYHPDAGYTHFASTGGDFCYVYGWVE